jgi:hypothetical protein
MKLRTVAIAASTFAFATLFSFGWSGQGGLALSTGKAEAQARIIVRPGYAASTVYFHEDSLPRYAARAYYHGGPWSGDGYGYDSWDMYAKRNGIGCVPGTAIKGGDGIMYRCH